ncbi:glycoside hydrolase family 127 protein [Anaerocolumna cellulosilytica]|nr:beta-L-arabinofuranosidase domain-containing protein [Anaerocolumna cellulosilytica]MBB5197218.1 hypothetical protein [Anaerocolumna cellulosilytica]
MDMNASNPLSLKEVHVKDSFWSTYIKLVKEVVIPYQWEVLNDNVAEAEPSHVMKNFRIAAGLEEGEFYGFFFQDTDLAKWLEAVAYSLQTTTDKELEKLADDAIDLVEKAQQPDGYLNTYFTIGRMEKRWTNLEECHELYTAGHFIEAGVAYHQATGKRKLLDVVCRFADYIDSVFGPEPGKIRGYDGHQEIELALVKLYRETGNDRYLNLSRFFIEERGQEPYYFQEEWKKRDRISFWDMRVSGPPADRKKYLQTHLPVKEQKEAVGHAVRVVYMLTGMAEVAKETGDSMLYNACKELWNNIVTKQMYITGGIGSTSIGEAFTFDYDLPNDTVYAETCASIGLIVFAQKMLQIENKSCYADVIERALYNVIISSMSRDGRHFFYVNPLEVWPKASEKNPVKKHVKPVRQKWFGCACCPPNLARLITSLGQYIYTQKERTLFVHQFISSSANLEIDGKRVCIHQTTEYPWYGNVRLELELEGREELELAIRIPGWCKEYTVRMSGKEQLREQAVVDNGYLILAGEFTSGTFIELKLDMPVTLMKANPKVRADAGKVVMQRGPVIYCLEEVDNGENLSNITLDPDAPVSVQFDSELLDGAITLITKGYRDVFDEKAAQGDLYQPYKKEREEVSIKAVPYGIWGNRTPGEMLVWVRI